MKKYCGCGSIVTEHGFCAGCNKDMLDQYMSEEAYEKYEILGDQIDLFKKESEMLQITEIKIFKLKDQSSNLKAFAKIVFEEQLVVSDLKVMNGKNGLFVSMPSKKNEKSGEWHDSVFPLTKDLRDYITKNVVEKYENESGEDEPVPAHAEGVPQAIPEEDLPF